MGGGGGVQPFPQYSLSDYLLSPSHQVQSSPQHLSFVNFIQALVKTHSATARRCEQVLGERLGLVDAVEELEVVVQLTIVHRAGGEGVEIVYLW